MEQLNVGTVCSGRTDNASATPALDALCRAYALTQCVHPLAPPGQRNCTADCAGACLLGLDRSGNHTGALALYLDAAAYAMAIPLNSVDPTAAIERRASVAAGHPGFGRAGRAPESGGRWGHRVRLASFLRAF